MDNVSSSKLASETSENVSGFAFFHRLFPLKYVFAYSNFFIQTLNRKYLVELFKRRPKVHQKKCHRKAL